MSQSTRVALYARVSTDMQAEEGKSIPAQLAEMHEYAKGREWHIVTEFIDPGYTGTTLDRPGLDAALEGARRGAFDILLVHELSRLSRRLFDTFTVFEKLGQHQVGFASVKDKDFDLSSPTDRLFLTFLAALNQYYIDLLKMHTAKSKRQRARDGLYNASIPPYGYAHVGDPETPPVIVEEEAVVVRKMFELYATGKYSYHDVAQWLTDDAGYKTRTGGNFTKDTVADMIRNRFYAGKIVYKAGSRSQDVGEVFPGKHEPIVSAELWEACRQIREQRRTAPRTYQPKYRVYLLNGLVTCDVCARKLRAQGAKAGSYYREVSKYRGFTDCPSAGRGARIEWVDEQVGVIFRRLRLPPDWQDELRALMEEDEDYEILENRRARLVQERKRLKRMKIRGEFEDDPDVYEQELARIQRHLAELPAPGDFETLENAASVLEELARTWDQMELADRRDLLRLALREVKVDVPQARVVSLEPYPIFIPLFRRIPLLREVTLGAFAPVWLPEIVQELKPLKLLPVVEAAPDSQRAFDWPLVTELPDAVVGKRINPILSRWLKARRRDGHEIGRIVELIHSTTPFLKFDPRTWPEVQIERTNDLGLLSAGAALFLWAPFAVQRAVNLSTLLSDIKRVVAPGGTWAFVDVMPASMPAHWLYRFFPEVWKNERQRTLDTSQMYDTLVKAEFRVHLERRTFYRSVKLGQVLQIAERREQVPQLVNLPDPVYRTRSEALEEMVRQEGEAKVVISEFCLVEVSAVRR
jgi:site-specific DNA recombinase